MSIHGFDPRLPALLWAVTAATLLVAALSLWPVPALSRVRGWWQRAPRLMGAVSAALVLTGGWWLGLALQLSGMPSTLLMLVAVLIALTLGIYLPGMPARAYARRRARLLLQTVDLAGYLQFAVASSQGDVDLLRGYIRRPQRPIADAQALIATTLAELDRRRRGNVFEVLHDHAVASGAPPLIACCTTLLHGARANRRALGPVLAQQREQLFDTVIEACKQRAQRLELLLIGLSAAALAFGLLPCILYVMTGGGAALGSFL
ncbi:MAG: hypothetical protein WCJ55_01385 [Chloroflexales bacterium]